VVFHSTIHHQPELVTLPEKDWAQQVPELLGQVLELKVFVQETRVVQQAVVLVPMVVALVVSMFQPVLLVVVVPILVHFALVVSMFQPVLLVETMVAVADFLESMVFVQELQRLAEVAEIWVGCILHLCS